jgi:hypothetical protein
MLTEDGLKYQFVFYVAKLQERSYLMMPITHAAPMMYFSPPISSTYMLLEDSFLYLLLEG